MKPLRKAILKLIRCRCTEGVRRKTLTTNFKSVHRGEKFKFPECAYKGKLFFVFNVCAKGYESVNSLSIMCPECDY